MACNFDYYNFLKTDSKVLINIFFAKLCLNFLEFGGNLNVQAITDFIDAGGNVLVGASSNVGKL